MSRLLCDRNAKGDLFRRAVDITTAFQGVLSKLNGEGQWMEGRRGLRGRYSTVGAQSPTRRDCDRSKSRLCSFLLSNKAGDSRGRGQSVSLHTSLGLNLVSSTLTRGSARHDTPCRYVACPHICGRPAHFPDDAKPRQDGINTLLCKNASCEQSKRTVHCLG
ncbi:hypothetical protein BDW22DRAFT_439690 [Trametopsis cervina]|nr:hypothetical protein BDW22DRAFT_439690 [Trametopsis cervina]